jgi:DNA polymerase III delta prime subunit
LKEEITFWVKWRKKICAYNEHWLYFEFSSVYGYDNVEDFITEQFLEYDEGEGFSGIEYFQIDNPPKEYLINEIDTLKRRIQSTTINLARFEKLLEEINNDWPYLGKKTS